MNISRSHKCTQCNAFLLITRGHLNIDKKEMKYKLFIFSQFLYINLEQKITTDWSEQRLNILTQKLKKGYITNISTSTSFSTTTRHFVYLNIAGPS